MPTTAKYWIGILACVALLAARPALPASSGPPQGHGTYDDFLALFEQFVAVRLPCATATARR